VRRRGGGGAAVRGVGAKDRVRAMLGISLFWGVADEENQRGRERERDRTYLEQYSITGSRASPLLTRGRKEERGDEGVYFVREPYFL
jgi:hypothetical protein